MGALALLSGGVVFAGGEPQMPDVTTDSDGFVAVPSAFSVAETATRLSNALDGNDAITLLGVVDHAQGAESVDLELGETRVILFGNPQLGTPLMQQQRSVGIDLPQKLVVWEEVGQTYVGYNTPDYLVARHGLSKDLDQLGTINGALANFASSVTDRPDEYRVALSDHAFSGESVGAGEGTGLVSVESKDDFETTVAGLREVLEEREFRIPFVVEHSAAAADRGLDLGATTLFIFGNPVAGTPLMQVERRIAADLPQKMLVHEDSDGTVYLLYNDPEEIVRRHGVTDIPDNAAAIANALEQIAGTAAE